VSDGAPIFFADGAEFRAWLEEHHASETEVWIGMWKAATGKPSIRWAEAVREALCFGWIDGQSQRIDDQSHSQRFTPRKSRRWSAVNVRLIAELEAEGLMRDPGRRAFEARDLDQVPYSTSDRPDRLPDEWESRLTGAAKAFWDACPPSYRKRCAFWVTEAKRGETKEKRYAELREACARGERLGRFTRS
jgi:uncharacterized protein YdeI (YjbR/CyaY-like superfamily)